MRQQTIKFLCIIYSTAFLVSGCAHLSVRGGKGDTKLSLDADGNVLVGKQKVNFLLNLELFQDIMRRAWDASDDRRLLVNPHPKTQYGTIAKLWRECKQIRGYGYRFGFLVNKRSALDSLDSIEVSFFDDAEHIEQYVVGKRGTNAVLWIVMRNDGQYVIGNERVNMSGVDAMLKHASDISPGKALAFLYCDESIEWRYIIPVIDSCIANRIKRVILVTPIVEPDFFTYNGSGSFGWQKSGIFGGKMTVMTML